jgi:hypothetical protein
MKTTNLQKRVHRGQVPGGHAYTCTIHTDANGREVLEQWASTEPDTLGRAAVPPVPTPIRVGRTRLGKCYVSFAITLPCDAMKKPANCDSSR